MLSKVNQITIYELSPAADEIWSIRKHDKEGYYERDRENGRVTFLDVPKRNFKGRPQVHATYAGGKATNVARVLDCLLDLQKDQCLVTEGQSDKFNVTLVTFLPTNPKPIKRPDGIVEEFTPRATHIICLQARDMEKIYLCPKKLPSTEKAQEEEKAQKDRPGINISDSESKDELLNFSPRLEWKQEETKTVQDFVRSQPPEGIVVLAGTPPSDADCLYRDMVEMVRCSHPNVLVSVDIKDEPLRACLGRKEAQPNFVIVNLWEYCSIEEYLWQQFNGTLLVHDKQGCWVWQGNGAKLRQNYGAVPYIDVKPLEAKFGAATGPTIGAGDAVHAGFILGWLRSKGNPIEAAMYGQAVAAAAVRNPQGTRGIKSSAVKDYFQEIKSGGPTVREPQCPEKKEGITMSVKKLLLPTRSILAWIFDWDGIFVDAEKWKAWTYGLGICDIWPEFNELEKSRFGRSKPEPTDPFMRVSGKFVGRSREEYASGLVKQYTLTERLNAQPKLWQQQCPDRIEKIIEERKKAEEPTGEPIEPWEVLYELRRPHYEKYNSQIEAIESNIRFLRLLPADMPVGLVTRTDKSRVRRLMEQFDIPVCRFWKLTCIPQKGVSKEEMYQRTADAFGIDIKQCAAVEDTEVGIEEARKAGVGLVIACPTDMTMVQDFQQADLVVYGGLMKLLAAQLSLRD